MNRSAEPLAPLIILCAPRSFSSVVCAMLGRHRALYGFPQLNLFLAATVAELLALDEAGPSSPAIHCAGILRTIAQLEFEEQSPEALVKARDWLNSRSAWYCRALFDYLLTRIAPCRGIDKSPSTGATRQNLLRLRRAYPKAFILHLTRDPRSTLRSLVAHYVNHSPDLQLSLTAPPAWLVNHYANLWSTSQRHIAEFIAETKPAQCFSIRGEDLLAHPQLELRSILTWLRLDHSALPLNLCCILKNLPSQESYRAFGATTIQVFWPSQHYGRLLLLCFKTSRLKI